MSTEMTPLVWVALGVGLLLGVLLAFLVWKGQRLIALILTVLAVAGGVGLAIFVLDSGAAIVTALLAMSVGNVLANVIRAKVHRRNKES